MNRLRGLVIGFVGVGLSLLAGGCPTNAPLEFIPGQTGDQSKLGTQPAVQVLSPTGDMAISGGTPIEVNWSVVATTNFATIDVVFDVDDNPTNDNEIIGAGGLLISDNSVVLDTANLPAGSYRVGVFLYERNELAAYDYSAGQITINQRADLYFTSPRTNYRFDRSPLITPTIDVAWVVSDPDSTITVQIFLDPDNTPNGNEILLRESDDQTGGSFSFDLPTANFEPGIYRILAIVSDGNSTSSYYAPATIELRDRLAGIVDLRDLGDPASGLSGAIFEGFNPRDNLGSFVQTVRDADSDGFDDFIMLAQFAKPRYETNLERTGVGEAYLIYGRPQRFSGVINVNSVGTLLRGEIYVGPPEATDPIRPSRGITSFTALSDWDGDGVREFAFGMPFVDSLGINLLDADGYFRSGAVVVAAGSALRPDLGYPGAGADRILRLSTFGTLAHQTAVMPPPCPETFTTPKSPRADSGGLTYFWRHLSDPTDIGGFRLGCRFSTIEPFDNCGETVSAYQYDSLIISAPNRDPVNVISEVAAISRSIPGGGVVSIYYCRTDDGFYPWTAEGSPPAADTYPGTPESDGLDTLPHGGPYHYNLDDIRAFADWPASPGYYVDADDSDPCVRAHDRRAGGRSSTVRLWTSIDGAHLGGAVAVGDINADGLEDLLVGSQQSAEGAGVCFIVLGRLRPLWISGELNLEELGLPMNGPDDPDGVRIFAGIRIVGTPGSRLGQSQAGAGDFNGDGLNDVVIGSPLMNNRKGGVAIFFGRRDAANLTQSEIAIDSLPQRGMGILIEGENDGDLAGARVAGVGDVDGDGLGDILIAAPNRSVRVDYDQDGVLEIDREECGVVYLVYGSSTLSGVVSLADIGTEKLPGAVFVGRNSGDHLGAAIGEQGDRSFGIARAGDVDGDGVIDLLMSSSVASPRDEERAGEVYLIYGTSR